MGRILVDDLRATHGMISDIIEWKRNNAWEYTKTTFHAVATLPTGNVINGTIEVWEDKYIASIALFSDNIDDRYIHEQFDANLYIQRSKWRAHRISKKQSHIIQTTKEAGIITSFTHTMEAETRKGTTVIGVQCGDEGTEGRSIRQPMEFEQSIQDLCYLANTLFHPYMRNTTGYPKDIVYRLNFVPKDEEQYSP